MFPPIRSRTSPATEPLLSAPPPAHGPAYAIFSTFVRRCQYRGLRPSGGASKTAAPAPIGRDTAAGRALLLLDSQLVARGFGRGRGGAADDQHGFAQRLAQPGDRQLGLAGVHRERDDGHPAALLVLDGGHMPVLRQNIGDADEPGSLPAAVVGFGVAVVVQFGNADVVNGPARLVE